MSLAALASLRWGEFVALRSEDLNWRRNRIVVSRALYRRVPGAPKTPGSEGEVPMCPTVRRILKAGPMPKAKPKARKRKASKVRPKVTK